jgi:hypothetical protein
LTVSDDPTIVKAAPGPGAAAFTLWTLFFESNDLGKLAVAVY